MRHRRENLLEIGLTALLAIALGAGLAYLSADRSAPAESATVASATATTTETRTTPTPTTTRTTREKPEGTINTRTSPPTTTAETTETTPSSGASTGDLKTCKELGLTETSTDEVSCTTPSATLTFVNGAHEMDINGATARVRNMDAFRASTASGQARNRMRVTIELDVTAPDDQALFAEPVQPGPAYLALGLQIVKPDPRFTPDQGGFAFNRLEPGENRRAELRFELAGSTTTKFVENGGQFALRMFGPDDQGRTPIGISRLRRPTVEDLGG